MAIANAPVEDTDAQIERYDVEDRKARLVEPERDVRMLVVEGQLASRGGFRFGGVGSHFVCSSSFSVFKELNLDLANGRARKRWRMSIRSTNRI